MLFVSTISTALLLSKSVLAIGGGQIKERQPVTYTAGKDSKLAEASLAKYPITGASYEYTGYGSAESSMEIQDDGTLMFSPAFANKEAGYLTSTDYGKNWTFIVPSPGQSRAQVDFNIHDGRYFFWSTSAPGLRLSYSDDEGKTWHLVGKNMFPTVNDWAKMVSGKPVTSQLKNGSKILYMSGPSPISVFPDKQIIWKSLDKGSTWVQTKGAPTLSPLKSGGPCAAFNRGKENSEYIIWSNGLVRPNGTVMYGVRRCRTASIAISDDEGDTWRWSDVPESSLVPYSLGLGTWVINGNVLTPEPLSQDSKGNLYFIWVDDKYVLKMAKSTDGAASWSKPIVISAPTNGKPLMTYHPILVQHPQTQGRAALAYYGSYDGGATWHGYISETGNIDDEFPVFSSIIVNEPSQPLQANVDKVWDQGYHNPFGDLVEFTGLRYHPKTGDLVSAFTRKMCSQYVSSPATFDTKTCVDGWDFHKKDNSVWQGFVGIAHH